MVYFIEGDSLSISGHCLHEKSALIVKADEDLELFNDESLGKVSDH